MDQANIRLSKIAETPRLEAQVLLAHQLNRERSWVLSHPEHELLQDDIDNLEDSLVMLENHYPLPYITGKCSFYGLEIIVTPEVLIPRPETEMLVDHALSWLKHCVSDQFVLDIGTGSGCIATAIAANDHGARLLALDQSSSALMVAKQNFINLDVINHCTLLRGDLTSAITGKFNLICANLPYIPSDKLQLLPVAQTEPVSALDGGPDGLSIINRLLEDLIRLTADKVCILLEIEAEQGQSARDLANQYFPDASISIDRDMAGLDRLLIIQRES